MINLLDCSVEIDKASSMTWIEKWDQISLYSESDGFEVVGPTTEICYHFKDRIGYCMPSSLFHRIVGNKLITFYNMLECIPFNSMDDIKSYLDDDKKKIYLSKVTLSRGIYRVYMIEKDDLPNKREMIIDKILDNG